VCHPSILIPRSGVPGARGGEMWSSTGPAVVSVPEVDAGRVSADDRLRWQWRAALVLADLIELASRAGLPPIAWTVGDAGANLTGRCYGRTAAAQRREFDAGTAALGAIPQPVVGDPGDVWLLRSVREHVDGLVTVVVLAEMPSEGASEERGDGSAILAYNRASAMRPFDFLTGPGVQPANTLEEAVEFPQALDPAPVGSRLRSSGPGNARRARWVAGQRYQAGHLPSSAADNLGDVAWRTGSKEVETR